MTVSGNEGDSGDARDGGPDDAQMDAPGADGARPDTGPTIVDAGPDSAAPPDATSPRGAVCPDPTADGITVAYYTFDLDPPGVLRDETGTQDGWPEGNTSYIEGPCGKALAFAAGPGVAHGVVEDHADFHTPEGSVELVALIPSRGPLGILSRDLSGAATTGHLSIFVSEEGRLVLRMQHQANDNAVWLCSREVIAPGTWVHLGASFGGSEDVRFWVDHQPADFSGTTTVTTGSIRTINCGTTRGEIGIGESYLPWVFGAYAGLRSATAPENLGLPFIGGAVDEVRIRSARIDFSSL